MGSAGSHVIGGIEGSPTFCWLFHLKAERHALFENYKLALLARFVQTVGFISLCYIYWTDFSFMKTSFKPHAAANMWIDVNTELVSSVSMFENSQRFCDPSSMHLLEYQSSGLDSRAFAPMGCVEPLPGDEWERSGDSALMVPTYAKENLQEQESGEQGCLELHTRCLGAMQTFHEAVDHRDDGEPVCLCETKSEYFLTGVGALELNIEANYMVSKDTSMAVLTDTFGKEKTKPFAFGSTGSKHPKLKVLLYKPIFDDTGKKLERWERRDMPRGEPIKLTLDELIDHAAFPLQDAVTLDDTHLWQSPVGQRLGGQKVLDSPNSRLNANSIEGKVSHPPLRMSGMEITVDLHFENEETDDYKGPVLKVIAKVGQGWQQKPTAFVLDRTDPTTGKRRVLTRAYQGLVIRTAAGGEFLSWSMFAMVQFLCTVMTYLQLVEILAGCIVMYLADRSAYYWYYEVHERIRMKRSLAAMITRAVGWHWLYMCCATSHVGARSSKDTGQEGLSMKADEFITAVSEATGKIRDRGDVMIRLLLRQMKEMTAENEQRITVGDMCTATWMDERIPLREFEEIYDSSRPWSLLEYVFLPQEEKEMYVPDDVKKAISNARKQS